MFNRENNKKMRDNNFKSLVKNLRGLLMLFLIVNFSVFSQAPPAPPPIDINAITTGYYNCYVDGKFIDKHTDRAKATTHCASLKANNPDALIGFDYPEFTQIKVSGYKTIEVDTIQVNRRLDVDGVSVRPFRDVVMGGQCYILTHEVGMVQFQCDSLPNWQTKFNLIQTKTFGKISYENLNIPFQYMDIWFDPSTETSTVINVQITEPYTHINSWIDGVQFKEFDRPNADGNNPFFFGISPLVKGVEYEFKMEVTNKAGEIITYETILKL